MQQLKGCCYTTKAASAVVTARVFLFAVEDKVKDQLEAANPEPIIEEVVSTCFCLNLISPTGVVSFSCFLSSGFGQSCSKKTRLVRAASFF